MAANPDRSLADWLRTPGSGTLAPQDVSYFVQQAASALQEVHNRRLVYQNVNPAHFLVHSGGNSSRLPNLQLIAGGVVPSVHQPPAENQPGGNSPLYIAPEQWQGTLVQASDQYALAVMTYELLTQRPPFQGTWREIREQHLRIPPLPPSTFNSRVSPALNEVLLRALAKRPQDRYPSISAFAEAFEQAVSAPAPSSFPAPQVVPVPIAPAAMGNGSRLMTRVGMAKRPTFLKELVVAGIVFIVIVSGIGFGLVTIMKNNHAAAFAAASPFFVDPLSHNTDRRWIDNASEDCFFRNGAYQVLAPANISVICPLSKLRFSNAIIQVDVSLSAESEAGLVFRITKQNGKIDFYDLEIKGQDGFFLRRITGYNRPDETVTVLASGAPPHIINSARQKNTLRISAVGSAFQVYINGSLVKAVQDKGPVLPNGFMGFVVETTTPTQGDASFSNLLIFPQ